MTEEKTGLTRRTALKHSALTIGLLAAGGSAATGAAAAGVGDARVAHYHLNNLHLNKGTAEKERNLVHDSSPYGNHGTNYGAEVVSGKVGNAYAFDGAHVAIADDESLGVEAVTVAAWVKPRGVKSREYIFDGRNHQYGIKEVDGTEEPRFFVFDDQQTFYRVDADVSLTDGAWTHVAGTYDGASMRIYVDGEHLGTNDSPSRPIGVSSGPSRIGDYIGDGYGFSGAIDDVRVYNRALSSDEVAELASMGSDS